MLTYLSANGFLQPEDIITATDRKMTSCPDSHIFSHFGCFECEACCVIDAECCTNLCRLVGFQTAAASSWWGAHWPEEALRQESNWGHNQFLSLNEHTGSALTEQKMLIILKGNPVSSIKSKLFDKLRVNAFI